MRLHASAGGALAKLWCALGRCSKTLADRDRQGGSGIIAAAAAKSRLYVDSNPGHGRQKIHGPCFVCRRLPVLRGTRAPVTIPWHWSET